MYFNSICQIDATISGQRCFQKICPIWMQGGSNCGDHLIESVIPIVSPKWLSRARRPIAGLVGQAQPRAPYSIRRASQLS